MWRHKTRQLALRTDDPGAQEPFRILAQDLDEAGQPVTVETSPRLARIEISGALVGEQNVFSALFGETSYGQIQEAIHAADASPAGTTLLVMRTPGGDVVGMGETAATLRNASNRTAVFAPKAFSAAYAIASGADVVAMPTDGRIGGLSTFKVSVDESGAAESAGVKVRIHSPDETKGAGFPGAPIPAAALKEFDDEAAKADAGPSVARID